MIYFLIWRFWNIFVSQDRQIRKYITLYFSYFAVLEHVRVPKPSNKKIIVKHIWYIFLFVNFLIWRFWNTVLLSPSFTATVMFSAAIHVLRKPEPNRNRFSHYSTDSEATPNPIRKQRFRMSPGPQSPTSILWKPQTPCGMTSNGVSEESWEMSRQTPTFGRRKLIVSIFISFKCNSIIIDDDSID